MLAKLTKDREVGAHGARDRPQGEDPHGRRDVSVQAALASAQFRPTIVRELRAEHRADTYAEWSLRMQKAAESKLVCDRDRLPEPGVVDISAYAPFLSLHEPEAEEWLAARRASG